MKTLHLVLKHKWYDLIDCGAKTSEYRACTPYWNRRLYFGGGVLTPRECPVYDQVVFHRGYTNKTMTFKIKYIDVTTEPNDLGLDECWEIKLGKRLA